ncbi:hypothetical protein AVEN_263059-1 [Araneus ventricosus]|uniref:Uncharacterized protein n=1 Tax=Araneus ventricosus TaxID=182803 RepID=A0A4Y2KK58_ARAVE|nr:hypothetical protein AVEN_263059-1 [Araneus ventricosus]
MHTFKRRPKMEAVYPCDWQLPIKIESGTKSMGKRVSLLKRRIQGFRSTLLSRVMTWWGRCGLVVTYRLRGQRVIDSKRDYTADSACMWGYCTLNHTYWARRPLIGVVRKLGDEVPAQVTSSSSDLRLKITRSVSK